MLFSKAEARFQWVRAQGLIRRGMSSLRTRGWHATWQRITAQLGWFAPQARTPLLAADMAPFDAFAVPRSAAPMVSIVIPVFNEIAQTLACLRAIAAYPPALGIEIIVVDDGSSDATTTQLPLVEGLRLHRMPANAGFIGACNAGATHATGRFLVFLNNDTVPQPGWLDALAQTFYAHRDVGLVGAQLLYPDGRLQESGGMLLRDGRAESRGRFADPEHPLLRYCCAVDYCSGAALMLERAQFEALDGFDTRYAPAYYEDTDLAFRIRARGLRVLVQPDARVIHVEGASAGTDPTRGMKAYQARNLSVFAARWSDALSTRPTDPLQAVQLPAPGTPQVLIVDNLTPAPDRDSASLRLVNLMRMLRDDGANVVFLPADLRHAGADTAALQALGIEVWYAPHAGSVAGWMQAHGHRFDSVMLSRHYVAREFLPLVRQYAQKARLIFDTVDLHYLREMRGADISGDATLRRNAMRTRTLELDIIARADVTTVVSALERDVLAGDAPDARVEVLSNLHDVAGPGLAFDTRKDLVFVGGFRHPPNVDAVHWFVDAIFPLIRRHLPDVRFHCIGGQVPSTIQAFAGRPGVVIHGHVPDISPFMSGCRIALAPLRFGAGVKGKVNLSMAHGQPVVATHCAAEGMHLVDGDDVLIADDAVAFADAVVRLYADDALWQRLSTNGLESVQRHFSLDAARTTVRALFLDHPQHPGITR